jgi:D-aminopeptidase
VNRRQNHPIRPLNTHFKIAEKQDLKGFQRLFGFVLTLLFFLIPIGSFAAESQTSGTNAHSSRIILPEWHYEPGFNNAITDVSGVKVGHVTIQRDTPHKIRTGVTAVVPHSGNLALVGTWANGRMLNGNGELTGLHFIQDSGVLNSPILLTNTFSIGPVHQGVFQYYLKHYPGPTTGSTTWPGQLPVVGECYDGFFNTIEDLTAVTPEESVKAIESATGGPVQQGRVGAGTGMRSFELHAGIGSASRRVTLGDHTYTIGVLVNMNHSRFTSLDPVIRAKLEERLGHSLALIRQEDSQDQVQREKPPSPRQGSIMVIIATDLPLSPLQLDHLSRRAALGIGALGSTMDTTSGDGVIAFSTAQLVPLGDDAPLQVPLNVIHPDAISPAYRATVEAVTEAQINALLASHSR